MTRTGRDRVASRSRRRLGRGQKKKSFTRDKGGVLEDRGKVFWCSEEEAFGAGCWGAGQGERGEGEDSE